MRCIISEYHNPYFNLASEEVLLKHRDEDYFLLYRNQPSIVVGKHQNTLAEINLSYVLEKDILVARRISGGGTVFHDLGNVNFAFITSGKEGELVDYRKHTRPILEALGALGLEVKLGKRNELLLGKKKISGTASHVFKNRVLHHGTLLFSSEMGDLGKSLKVSKGKFDDRAVKSIPSPVTNISPFIVNKIGIEDFQGHLSQYILDSVKGSEKYQYNKRDIDQINELRDSKFSTWEWNFAYSPRYQFNRSLKFRDGVITLHMNVDKGVIREVSIEGDFIGPKDIQGLVDLLVGTIHDPATLRLRLDTVDVKDYITGLENEQLLSGLF